MGRLLKKAVGAGSNANLFAEDVKIVIQLLNNHIENNLNMPRQTLLDLNTNGNHPDVISAIEEFQDKVQQMKSPDGRVDPGGKSIKALQKTPKDSRAVLEATGNILLHLLDGPIGGISTELWNAALLSMLKHVNHEQLVKYDIITIVDYTVAINVQRLWLIDLDGRSVIMHVHCSHGSGTRGAEGESVRVHPVVSNTFGSNQSCVGGFVTLHERMTELGGLERLGLPKRGKTLVAEGLDPTNDRMKNRGIFFHGAWYMPMPNGNYGLSHGCFATKPTHNNAIIDRIKDGSFGYSYNGVDSMP